MKLACAVLAVWCPRPAPSRSSKRCRFVLAVAANRFGFRYTINKLKQEEDNPNKRVSKRPPQRLQAGAASAPSSCELRIRIAHRHQTIHRGLDAADARAATTDAGARSRRCCCCPALGGTRRATAGAAAAAGGRKPPRRRGKRGGTATAIAAALAYPAHRRVCCCHLQFPAVARLTSQARIHRLLCIRRTAYRA